MALQAEIKGAGEPHRVGGMFRALSHRNYRLFWTGAFLSNVGTWMQAVAQGWLVLQLTNSPFWLGMDGFMATAPGLVLTLAGGVFADLIDRKKLLIYTQAGSGISALVLGALIMTGAVKEAADVWIVLLLTFVTGCCMSLAGPSYQAITFDLVEREDLANAVALNSTQFQLGRLVGPALAGPALTVFGLAGCFFANGLSYVLIIIALSMVHLGRTKRDLPQPLAAQERATPEKHAFWPDLIEGFRYVRGRPRVFMLLLISAVTSLFGAPYLSMMPHFARDILHLGEWGLSILMGASGAGAFCGALVLAYLGDFKYKGWSVLGGAFSFAVCLIGFALSVQPVISVIFIFCMGVSIVASVAVSNTLLQQLVQDKMRGRVMSMFMLSFIGAMPISNLIAGVASHRFGAPHTFVAGGLVIALFVIIVAIKDKGLRELR
ncbi:MAG TPA: MFS transporter [Pyrinomonadaceae bacterium]|jgi:MFS family permease